MKITFNPKFTIESDISVVADKINLPHEDYPKRVNTTESLIHTLIDQNYHTITEFDAKTIHSVVMSDLPSDKGKWRSVPVTVGNDTPPSPELIEDSILENNIFPVTIESDLVDWYKKFQTIHPFIDGNGRVGGIIIAVLSALINKEEILTPMQ